MSLISRNLRKKIVLKQIQKELNICDELIPKLQHSFATKPTAYWQGKCRERNIPCPNHGEHQIEIMDQLKITNDNKGAI